MLARNKTPLNIFTFVLIVFNLTNECLSKILFINVQRVCRLCLTVHGVALIVVHLKGHKSLSISHTSRGILIELASDCELCFFLSFAVERRTNKQLLFLDNLLFCQLIQFIVWGLLGGFVTCFFFTSSIFYSANLC